MLAGTSKIPRSQRDTDIVDAPNRLPNSDRVSFRFRRNLSICRDHSGMLAALLGHIFVTRLKLHWQACLAQEYSLQFFRY
jgi:hypothetical protein